MKELLITSSILIVLIAALRPVLRGRIDPRAQYALWLLAALRLLLPVNLFTSAYSALALLERAEDPPRIVETVEALGQATIPSQSYDSARAVVIEQYRQQGVEPSALTPRDLMDVDAQAKELMRGPTLAELAAQYARPVWLGGAALAAAWFAFVNLRLRRRLRDARRVETGCPLPVYVSEALPSPCLFGAFRPAVYLTPAAAESPDRLRHVLTHEYTHYRHRDHWWALVRCACLCLYWFDPLVWWAAALSRQDCELACDEGAIRALGEGERIPYGRTLVGMIAAGRNSLLQTATTMTGGKRRVRERVKLIARKPKTVIALALAAALLVGCAVGCTFSGAPDGNPNALTLDSLQDRLMDLPEEAGHGLGAQSLAGESFLVKYWMQEPWADFDEGLGWLLTVYQWNQEEFDQHYSTLTGQYTCIAQSEDFYFVLQRATDVRYPLEEQEAYQEAYGRIRAYAEKAVLETEGVEPYAGLPVDTLQERLLELPEELRAKVEANASETKDPLNNIALASYWWDVPAEWESERSPWLLSVHQWERGAMTPHSYPEPVDGDMNMEQLIAMSEEYYFTIERFPDARLKADDEAAFFAVYQDILNFVKKTVLETEGVEPYAPSLPADTLVERLQTIPEDLLGDAALFPTDSLETTGTSEYLAFYVLDNPTDPEWEGMLLAVCRWDQVEFENWLYNGASGFEVFARDGGGYYYALLRPSSVQCAEEDAERYAAAARDIEDYARQAVLSTEGVESYDPSELLGREHLWEGKTYTYVAYWPYKAVNGNTADVWIYTMVQLARDGEGGVWIPERVEYLDKIPGEDLTPHHIKPDTGGRTVTEYAQWLQAEADAGRADWATDPIEALRRYEEQTSLQTNIPLDSFTDRNVDQLRPENRLTPEQKAIQAVTDALAGAPSLRLLLTTNHQSYAFDNVAPPSGYWANSLDGLAARYEWEAYTDSMPEDVLHRMADRGGLVISAPDGTELILHETANVIMITKGGETGTTIYRAVSSYGVPLDEDSTILNPGPYHNLRSWYDSVELQAHQDTFRFVDVRENQTLHDIASEWAMNHESALVKAAPGGSYSCTYVDERDVGIELDWPDNVRDSMAQRNGVSPEDYGKTWFPFGYVTVFVPENQNAEMQLWAGNTDNFTGDNAPEGALYYSRCGIMYLTENGWTCDGVGTGW